MGVILDQQMITKPTGKNTPKLHIKKKYIAPDRISYGSRYLVLFLKQDYRVDLKEKYPRAYDILNNMKSTSETLEEFLKKFDNETLGEIAEYMIHRDMMEYKYEIQLKLEDLKIIDKVKKIFDVYFVLAHETDIGFPFIGIRASMEAIMKILKSRSSRKS